MKSPLKQFSFKQSRALFAWFSEQSAKKKIAIYALGFFLVLVLVFGIAKINGAFMVEVPARGGTLTEGVVGLPRYINPVLATTSTDRNITSLVYASLLKHTADGGYAPELAKDYSISDDGRTYTVTLKDNLTWHDGTPLTADDVLFTIKKIKNEQLRSPKGPDWRGVTVLKKNSRVILFNLKEPYGPFLENLTVGILSKHLWKSMTPRKFLFSKLNIHPIGSGPYQIEEIAYDTSGIPTSYTLSAFENYALGEPRIQNIVFRFYPTSEERIQALKNGEIESAGSLSPEIATQLQDSGYTVRTAPLLRTFAVFFNQNEKKLFTNDAIRKALTVAANKEKIVKEALLGFGNPISGPLPEIEATTTKMTREEAVKKAKNILQSAGWTYDTTQRVYKKETDEGVKKLTFTLTTSKAPELMETAKILKQNWEEVGAKVSLQFLDISAINQKAIRSREYEALLFGQVIGHNPDLYAFWHSSQRTDPGLNVGLFTSIEADTILEEARAITDIGKRKEKYREFRAIFETEQPAIFLYSPEFIYAIPEDLRGVKLGPMAIASEHFFNISKWYLQTENVWRFFLPDKEK